MAGYPYLLYPGLFYTLGRRGRWIRAMDELKWRRDAHGVPVSRSLKEVVKLLLPRRFHPRRRHEWIAAGHAPETPAPGRTLKDHHLYGLTVAPLPMYNHQLDRISMSVSIESRNPFLDYRVVQCGLALRPEEYVRKGFTKWSLREALRDTLPKEILERRDKQGFTTDEGHWTRRNLGRVMEATFRSPSMASRGYFDTERLLTALPADGAGNDFAPVLWRAFIVERWLRLFVDPVKLEGRPVPPAVTTRPFQATARLVRPPGGLERAPA